MKRNEIDSKNSLNKHHGLNQSLVERKSIKISIQLKEKPQMEQENELKTNLNSLLGLNQRQGYDKNERKISVSSEFQ